MTCTSPIRIRTEFPVKTPVGLRFYMEVPCNRCMACRIRRRAEWTTRLYHEMGYHYDAKFVTLTYECNPVTVNPKNLQDFVKRFRKNSGQKIKYYAVGEYGDETGRPHYHLIIYSDGLIRDVDIRKSWGLGLTSTEECCRETIQYVAGYIEKKLIGKDADEYKKNGLCPPFSRQSQGLGKAFCLDNAKQIRDNLKITLNGNNVGIPRYYKKVLGIERTDMMPVVAEANYLTDEQWKKRGVYGSIAQYKASLAGKKQHELNVTAKTKLKSKKI